MGGGIYLWGVVGVRDILLFGQVEGNRTGWV